MSENDNELLKCCIKEKESNDDTCVVFIGKLGEKRSVPLASLRPLNGAEHNIVQSHRADAKLTPTNTSIEKYGYGSCNATSPSDEKEKLDDLVFDYDAIYEITKSLDFDSYINLSNFKLTPNNQQEIIAYPMVYSHSNNMNSNNSSGNTNTGGSKKIRNQNASNLNNVQCDANDKQQHIKTDAEENVYGKNVHDSKPDLQQKSQTGGYYQSQDQNVDASIPMSQQQMSNYYHQSAAPIYYCPTPEYSETNMYSSEMVMPHGVYAVPTHAYQVPPMQPNMYAPMAGGQTSHYPVHVGSWPGYNPQANTQGK